MKMKITFHNPSDEDKEYESFTESEKMFFTLLMEKSEFVNLMRSIRELCHIHPEGIAKIWPLSESDYKSINFFELNRFSEILTKKMKLHSRWKPTLNSLLFGVSLMKIKLSRNVIKLIEKDNYLLIKVDYKTSKSDLIEQLRKSKELKRMLEKLPKIDLKVGKKNLRRDLAFRSLSKKFKTREIADVYNDHFGVAFGENVINEFVKRMNSAIDKIYNYDGDLLRLVLEME